MEVNGGQEFLVELIRGQADQLRRHVPLWCINNVTQKELRIREIGPFLAQDKLRFKKGSEGAQLLVTQLQEFPVGEFVDGPDALEMALRTMLGYLGKEYQGSSPYMLRT